MQDSALRRSWMKTSKQVWLVASVMIATLLVEQSASGAVRAHEPFNYDSGSELNGADSGVGWTDVWFAEPIATVEDKAINFGGETGAPKAALVTGSDFLQVLSRPFAPVSDTLYMGLLIRAEEWDDDFIQLQVSDGATGNSAGTMTIGLDGRDPIGFYARTGTSGDGSSFSDGAIFETDTDYFLVGKFSKDGGSATYNRVDLFVNPEGLTEPELPDATREGVDSTVDQLSLFTMRNALMEGPELIYLDELRIGTTFNDVLLAGGTLPDPGDFNADGVINRADFDIMRTNFQEPGDFSKGDMNFSGFVDLQDFADFLPVYQAANGVAQAVPEPGASALLSAGAVLLLLVRRRRRR